MFACVRACVCVCEREREWVLAIDLLIDLNTNSTAYDDLILKGSRWSVSCMPRKIHVHV